VAAPPPPPPPAPAAPRPPTPRVTPPKPFEAPKSVPSEPLKEADPSQETGAPSSGPGDPAGLPGGKEGGKPGGDPTSTSDGPGAPSTAPAGPVVLPAGAKAPQRLDPDDKPEYPAGARSARIEGEVIVKVVVKVDGSVELVKFVKSAPPFDDAVRAFLPKMRYRPAIYDGRPIAVYQNIRFPFTLR
jgi:protein TonB